MENKLEKISKVDMHISGKKKLFIVVSFSLVSIGICLIFFLSSLKQWYQLDSLIHSSYEYSAISNNSIGIDDYYKIDAGLSFKVAPDSNKAINAEVLMQSQESEYSAIVSWNTYRLSKNGIAISENIARIYGISEGDSLYSKHAVDGKYYNYIIEKIIPKIIQVRSSEDDYVNGIIIMGFDSAYIDNILHSSVFFTNEPIDDIIHELSENPEDIIYRKAEVLYVIKNIIPYFTVEFIMSFAIMIFLVVIVSKMCEQNFKRFIIMGVDKKTLDGSFNRQVLGIGIFVIAVMVVLSAIMLFFYKSVSGSVFILCISLAETVSMFIFLRIRRIKMWRVQNGTNIAG